MAKQKLIENKNAGIETQPNNPDDMVNKLIELKNNPELVKQMKLNSRKLAQEEFNKTKILDTIESIFNKLLAEK